MAERIADRYELQALVGSGGMASVYRAWDTLLERSVALKILHPHHASEADYLARFRREARAVARLTHPNIVTLLDRGEENGCEYIVFEYIEGETLKQLLARRGALPVRRAVELALQVARGLAYAHAKGLVHRDVKPQNVLVGSEGEAKLSDFGIARALALERGITDTGTVLGTSAYLAPEQASGHRVDARADVYSLGALLYELLAGSTPFSGDNFVAVALQHVHEPPPRLLEHRADVPPRLAAAVERALEKDPDDRFPSMAEFAAELEACLGELEAPEEARTLALAGPLARERLKRLLRRHRGRLPLLFGLLAGLLAAAVLAGLLLLGGSQQSNVTVQLHGVGTYDPQGNGGEHGASAPLATDGNPATYWRTETYASPQFGNLKQGLGLVLDAGRLVRLKRLTVTTDTPGFQAQVRAGASSSGGFQDDSASTTVSARTTFTLAARNARYYLLWITRLPNTDVAHVDEVTATS